MDRSSTTESEDGLFCTDSPLSNDGDNLNGLGIILKKGPWTSAEDAILVDYVKKHGEGNWNAVQKHSGLSRCGKSCRLRWANHLRPNLRKGAFTPEEERLIIEFHAKMGNKWSRIAAHLPGRTDNEIKNYWNTRIKRRQRAGLPLYPPDMPLHAHPENQQQLISPGIYGDNRCHDIMQSNGYRTPDNMLDSFDILPYTPEFHGISGSVSKGNIFSTPHSYSFVSQTKFALEAGETMEDHVRGCPKEALPFERALLDGCINKMPQSIGLHFPYILDHTKKPLPFGANQDSYRSSNVIFSASKPVAGAQKLELPSLQCQQTSFGLWNPSPESMDPAVFSTPLSQSGSFFSSHCPSRGRSGLLEDLLYEAKALSNQSSDWTTSSNYNHGGSYALKACSTEVKDRLDPGSPLACELKSEMLNGSSILDAGRENVEHNLEPCRPDAILGSYGGWIGKNVKQPSCHMATEGTLEGGNISANRGLRSSCSWNNTPTVRQVSGFTSVLPNF